MAETKNRPDDVQPGCGVGVTLLPNVFLLNECVFQYMIVVVVVMQYMMGNLVYRS